MKISKLLEIYSALLPNTFKKNNIVLNDANLSASSTIIAQLLLFLESSFVAGISDVSGY